jgi:hypothetical protein
MRPYGETLLMKFIRQHEPEPNSGCWIWAGYSRVDKNGDVTCIIQNRPSNVIAKRFAFEEYIGEILDGCVVRSACGNDYCVNPYHLEMISKSQKFSEARAKRYEKQRSKKNCIHGHLLDQENTYIDSTGARHCKKCRAAAAIRRRTKLNLVGSARS